jgi:PAS domain S-box-containing protein
MALAWSHRVKQTPIDKDAVTREGTFRLRRFLLIPVVITMIPALALILYNTNQERHIRMSAIRDDAQRIVQLAAVRHNRLVDSTRELLFLLSEVPDVKNAEPSSCRRILKRLLDHHGYYTNLGVIRPDGTVSCSALESARSVNVSDRPYFQRALETKTFATGDYQIGRISRKASIGFVLPILNDRGDVAAMLFAGLDLKWLNTLAAEVELPKDASFWVFDNQATVLATFPDSEKWQGKKLPESLIFRTVQTRGRGVDEFSGLDDVRRVYAFTTLGVGSEKGRTYMLAGIPKELAATTAEHSLMGNLFWLGVTTLLAVAIAWVVGKNFIVKYVEERGRADEAHLQLAAIVESCEDAIIGKTLDGNITTWNAGAEAIYGYTAEEVLGHSITLLNPPDRPNEIPAVLDIIKQGKGLNRYETERIRKDGRRLCVSASVSPIKDNHGNIIGASTIARDITAAKRAEEKLHAHASQMETLYTVAQEVGGTLALDEVLERALNRMISASGFVLAFIHFTGGESQREVYGAGGRSPGDALQVLHRIGEEFEQKIIECKEPWLVENTEVVAGLERVYSVGGIRGLAVLPVSGNEQFRGTLTLMSPRFHSFLPEESQFLQALAQQIGLAIENASLFSATVRMNENLQEEVEVRKQTEKTLADFTAMVVHDLRSPLSNIVSVIESLRNELFGTINEQQSQWLRKMHTNCIALIDHISDFLDLSKIDAGHVELEKMPVHLAALIYENLVEHSIQADKRNIRLNMEIEKDLPILSLDPRRLNQVLGNLLSNALKFTPEGGQVEVGASAVDANDVIVWVKDTGVGIREEEAGQIFEMYRQLSGGRHSAHLGTGLGLAICKKIVEAHGGRIWVNSEENKGTIFSFSLPINVQSHFEFSQPASPSA